MKKLKKGERGFTLIEMLVVLVLIGIITGGITAGIRQVLTINTRASNHMIAVRQVQQAGKEVSKDALQAQPDKINVDPPGGAFLAMNWTSWEGQENAVIYTITDDNELQRSYTINGGDPTVIRIAQYIDPNPDQTSCSWNNVTLTFKVTATIGIGSYGAIETRVYEIEPRPDS